MDHISGLGGDECFHRLIDNFGEIFLRQDPTFDCFVERFSLEEFHYDETTFIILADIKNRDDVRVIQRGKGLCFGNELARGFFDLLFCRLIGREDSFHRDFPLKLRVECFVNGAEATFSDLLSNFVATAHQICGNDCGGLFRGRLPSTSNYISHC